MLYVYLFSANVSIMSSYRMVYGCCALLKVFAAYVVLVCVLVCVRARTCACVRACARARARACVCVCVCVWRARNSIDR